MVKSWTFNHANSSIVWRFVILTLCNITLLSEFEVIDIILQEKAKNRSIVSSETLGKWKNGKRKATWIKRVGAICSLK